MPDPNPNQVTDTSGITEGDGHFLHDHPDIMGKPAAKNALAKYTNVSDAMMGGVDAMTLIGRPHLNIPADDAADDVKAKFAVEIAKHSGAVANVEDFKVDRPDGADETNYNYATEKAFLAESVNLQMNQKQMAGMLKMHNEVITASNTKNDEADKAAQDAAKVKLTSDWGGEEKYKENMELNTRCLEAFFDADTAKMIEEKGIGNHVGFAKGINELAAMAVKEGRTMKAGAKTQQKDGKGSMGYPKMQKRLDEENRG